MIERVGAVVERIHIVGLERERPVVARNRIGMALKLGERIAVVVVRLRKVRRERGRARKALGSLGDTAEINEGSPAIAPVRDRAGIMRERAVEARDRVREPAKLDQRVSAAAMRVGSAERNRLIEACQRLGVAPGVAERHAE